MVLTVAREFMRGMAQPFDRLQVGRSLLSEAQVNALDATRKWRVQQYEPEAAAAP
jgi:hypothetical protein